MAAQRTVCLCWAISSELSKSHTLKDLKEFWRRKHIILTSLLSLALKAQHQTLTCYLTKLVGVWQPQSLGGNGLGPDFHSICTPFSHWKHQLLCLDPLHTHLFHTLWGEAWQDTELLTRQLTYSPPSASGNSAGKSWGAPCWWVPCSRTPASLGGSGGSFPALADRSATTCRVRKTTTGRRG